VSRWCPVSSKLWARFRLIPSHIWLVLLLLNVACGPVATLPAVQDIRATIEAMVAFPTATPTPTPIVHEQQIDLTNRTSARSSVHAELGNRVEVSIEVRQKGDPWGRCGEPVARDAFGNVMAALSPVDNEPGEWALYKYAFYAPVTGLYSVELQNEECDIRETSATATVRWTVHHR